MSDSSFSAQMKVYAAHVVTRSRAVFTNVASAAKESIVNGSPVTGSPGQPVDTAVLKDSWILDFESPESALISTKLVYALFNEYGVTEDGRPYTQRSAIGGRHSVALTIAGIDRLVADETRTLGSGQ